MSRCEWLPVSVWISQPVEVPLVTKDDSGWRVDYVIVRAPAVTELLFPFIRPGGPPQPPSVETPCGGTRT